MKNLANLARAINAQLICEKCGTVPLTEAEYKEQLADIMNIWQCPKCSQPAKFDDSHWSEVHFAARRGDFEED